MKILYVDLETEWRGGQSQALEALRGLRRAGHDAQLLGVTGGALAQRARDAGVPTIEIEAARKRWRAAGALRSLLSNAPPDVIHANESHALTAAWLARAHRRTTLVAARRLAYPIQRNPISLARYRAAHRIFAISDFVARSVVASGLPAERVVVVREGIEIPPLLAAAKRLVARQIWNFADDEIVLGCVGYLLPEKGQDLLVRALATICAATPRVRLLLAGDGPLRVQLESLATQLKIRDRIVFAGFVERIAYVYAALDVFVFPSLAEPSGTSLLAALGGGTVLPGCTHAQAEAEPVSVTMAPDHPDKVAGMDYGVATVLRRLRGELAAKRAFDRSARDEVADIGVGGLDPGQGLTQVDEIDPVALAQNEALHLRVPSARLVAEVDPGFQQLSHGNDGHKVFLRSVAPQGAAPQIFGATGIRAKVRVGR